MRFSVRAGGGRFLVLAGLLAASLIPLFGRDRQDDDSWIKPRSAIAAEFGIDSLSRKFYRPEFRFAWPLGAGGESRLNVQVSFLQRSDGKLRGAVDYWVRIHAEKKIGAFLSLEAGLDHFCRHKTSADTPYVLNLNELLGRLWVRTKQIEAGLGLGSFIGGSPGYNRLMSFDLVLPRLVIPELRFESCWKWVNFQDLFYETTLSLGLAGGAEIFIRGAREYGFPDAAYLGVRFRSDGYRGRLLDAFGISAGVYPFYNVHKVLIDGDYRLNLFKDAGRRLLLDVGFRTPLLTGDGFFAQFWPDRMQYAVGAEYEKPLPGGLFVSWYARYFVDMPVDKAVRFRSSLATGLLLRNQDLFDRLEAPVRFEIAAGYDFDFAYDVRVKLGAQAKLGPARAAGADLRIEANNARQTAEFKVFMAFGKEISVRPFIGIRQISFLAGGPPKMSDPFKNKLTFGIAFLELGRQPLRQAPPPSY